MALARYKDLCIDATQPDRMQAFWGAVIGLAVERRDDGQEQLVGATPQHGVWICEVPEPRTVKQRVHIDVHATSVEAVERLGAVRLSADGELPWTVMADPEGGELCVFVREQVGAYRLYEVGVDAADRLAESEEAFLRALKLVPQRLVSNALLALVKMDQGRADDALEQAMKEPYEMWRLWALAILYHAVGDRAKSDEALQTLTGKYADGNAYQIAEAHSVREEIDQAFEWLEKAYEERDPGITHTMVNPRLRPLHGDPRWVPLLSKIGFAA